MNIITRAEWGARPPRSWSALPSHQGLTFHWEGTTLGAYSESKAYDIVRSIQRYHMDGRSWADIAYNFLVSRHGQVFEGRGWGRRSAANGSNAGNSVSYAVVYLGGPGDPLTEAGKEGLTYITRGAPTGGRLWVHHDWRPTQCPGPDITAFVRNHLYLNRALVTTKRKGSSLMLIIRSPESHHFLVSPSGHMNFLYLNAVGELREQGVPVVNLDSTQFNDFVQRDKAVRGWA